MKNILIDVNSANKKKNMLWRSLGMVSANNSSRLLIDYKSEHPDKYNEILNLIFGNSGLAVSHLKIEMGSDINSSSGTEPAIMRTEDEYPDVTRGAGFILANDAKKINPDLTLDMLWWSEPKWIEEASDVYKARYKWYKANLTEAYKKYGLKFDYVSATQNERAWDTEWIKYLSENLKNDLDTVYDFSGIKIVAGEEVCTWNIADLMKDDQNLMQAIDVIGSHYTSWSSENAKYVQEQGKELWFSEASSPMKNAEKTCRFDNMNSGLSGINGCLDIADRIITMYASGKMTLCELQPVVSSYYDGVTYCSKQLITANEPWSGYYSLDAGFYMALHFSQFIKKGWSMIDSACFSAACAGGPDMHGTVNTECSYIAACDSEKNNFSLVMCNQLDKSEEYEIEIKNLDFKNLKLWETTGPENIAKSSNINYLRKKSINFLENNKIKITVAPYSLISLSTLDFDLDSFTAEQNSKLLELPYSDDFSYKNYDDNYLSERGFAPRYTTDEGGAFEVVKSENNYFLQQKITYDIRSKEWGYTPNPVTNLGDDRWFNYSAGIDLKFDENSNDECYGGIGIRYNLPDQGENGLWIQLFKNGKLILNEGKSKLFETNVAVKEWNTLKISAVYDCVSVWCNNELIISEKCSKLKCSLPSAGRAAIYSSYNKNLFKNLLLKPESESYFIQRFDDTDFMFNYAGEWKHSLMDSFKFHSRTMSEGNKNSELKFKFYGTAFNLTGVISVTCYIQVKIDNKIVCNRLKLENCDYRHIFYLCYDLENKEHEIEIKILSGKINFDTCEILKVK